jgi:hypothetical protein
MRNLSKPARPPGLRAVLVVGLVAWLGQAAATSAQAPADGLYKPTSLTGYVRLGGEKINLPLAPLRNALLTNGLIPVQGNRLPVNPSKWEPVLEGFKFKGIRGKARGSGPTTLRLTPAHRGFRGSTSDPVTVKMKGRYKFVPVTMTMRTRLQTRILDGTLTMSSPVEISVIGISMKGSIELTARQLEIPF